MASIVLLPSSKYRAQLYISGTRESRVFKSKREAQLWATSREAQLRAVVKKAVGEKYTLGEALDKYVDEVSPAKRGERWERIRINSLKKILPIGESVGNITPEMIGIFRDARLKQVSPGTVLREIGLLSSVFETARIEWRWIDSNPVNDVRKPKAPEHRDVVITSKQICTMLKTMGYSPRKRIDSVSKSVAMAFLLALRTGMRAGELCSLAWGNVYQDHVRLPVTKTVARNVPLTRKMLRLIDKMRGYDPVYVLGVSSKSLDAMFRKYRNRAGLGGFTFHDTRHTAATWMVRDSSLNVLELCKIFGWKDPKQAMVYFNPSPKDLAGKMTKRA